MENKKQQKQAKKADQKKLSEKEMKNTKGGGFATASWHGWFSLGSRNPGNGNAG
ncbi:MAG: hypothetical protein Kapaf2KO_10780 [Candidatus Kapaibacteriales bacterium]